MTNQMPWSGTVHWVGAGLSNGSGVRRVADQAARLVLWNRDVDRAKRLAAKFDLTDNIDVRPYTLETLESALKPGDIVVSMLPATQHPALLASAIRKGAHFGCSSYVSDAISAQIPDATKAGLVVLTECGLDPGLDHLFAHELVAVARRKVEAGKPTIRFRSYCGGIPAVPNDFRYLFSWAPLGVLLALRSSARFVRDFSELTAPEPWLETRPYTLKGETFEVYPNRDSVPFVEQYGIPDEWRIADFVRGTLRLDGWREAWRDVFEAVRTYDDARLAAFANELRTAHPMTEHDLDRVILAVTMDVLDGDRLVWSGVASLDAIGDPNESAMARYVSLPLACGIVDIADGELRPGLHRAVSDQDKVRRWLDRLRKWGLNFSIGEAADGGRHIEAVS